MIKVYNYYHNDFFVIIRAVTLEGASDGIYFYIVPDLAKLANIEVFIIKD